MCGIGGIINRGGKPVDPILLENLREALLHRGPDGSGRYVSGPVGFVHTRLAIVDLVTGDQPLYTPSGLCLIGNGEIYNNPELRAELSDVNFRTRSDCEPPLYLYERMGSAFADRLRGMYALALHDPANNRVLLARDPFGIKPLYIVETADGIAFASEPQSLIAAGLAKAGLDRKALASFLQLKFSTGQGTVFPGIRRLLPGETVVIEDGRIVESRIRPALPAEEPRHEGTAGALDRLEKAMTDSVMVHQRSDLPYGLFLSGGIDSATVLALMARLNDRPVVCLTAGFPDARIADERSEASRLARMVGAEHEEITFTEADFWSTAPQVAAALDDPTADYAVLPTFKLAQRARQRGLKVVLCGEGGDEILAGYSRYRRAQRPWWMFGRRPRNSGIFDDFDGLLTLPVDGWRDGIAAAEKAAEVNGRSKLQRLQAADCAEWLPNDLLNKLDRCLMANGVEGRTPFLDPVVAEAGFLMPDRLKIQGRMGKWILRTWLQKALPDSKAFAEKQGFDVPVGQWIARRGTELGPLVAASPGVAEIARADAVKTLFASGGKRAGLAAWTLLFYALWHRRHIQGLKPEGDVFHALDSAARAA
ncbi:MAG: asparagine synthase (glutamine-hydrolyzing) [Ferrovibrionaceae bacterium]